MRVEILPFSVLTAFLFGCSDSSSSNELPCHQDRPYLFSSTPSHMDWSCQEYYEDCTIREKEYLSYAYSCDASDLNCDYAKTYANCKDETNVKDPISCAVSLDAFSCSKYIK